MRPAWESGLRGRLYALGRRAVPLGWRRALRRRFRPERLLGIRKPETETAWTDPSPGVPQPGREDVVVLPVIAWSYRRQRPQQLAEALARRGRRVFYASLAGSGEPAEPAGAGHGVTLLPIPAVRREDPADRRLEEPALGRALAGLAASAERFGIREAVLLVQSPFWWPLADAARRSLGWRIAYDCMDAHAAFPSNRPGILDASERGLAAGADLVTATSEALRRRLEGLGADARLLPNACDYDLFAGLPLPSPDPDALTVGYVGAVDAWFDMDLVARMAALSPRWRFEIVGGVEDPSTRPPRGLSNLVFHGERPHREMPGWRGGFDAEMIPFRLSPLTHATDPVKLYEAAASGRPVVATPMESLAPFSRRGLVRLASTPEEFVRALGEAAAAARESAPALRAFARQNTWDDRAGELDEWIAALRRATRTS